jgi:hypothetical protein
MGFTPIASAASHQFVATLPWVKHVDVQIEGRGNGIKTNTVNLVDISKALERPPDCESPAAGVTTVLGHMSTTSCMYAMPASK